ncbi:hypothetical protein PAESOLCIP111_00357 [Paenibacillus solanacearum]|uniref:Copper amine oxidase-like N-terminal domain-containing protein n=1 Tax=Paenibacillus solanacearum TaxID=2048548 RepID=A0A916JSF1_9BACL|nr:stalk domain-containing protein [Paenibacillus solanacearum]CAG7599984.1 hypothetical protein PAESOLCIP111_00357 [Paenibacillus solanacearum]
MKKKIAAVSVALMLLSGVVSAASINGNYNGNPIVIVTSNGKALEIDEVPAQIIDGHTLVPISLLRQIGASVTWDAKTYGVDVKMSGSSSSVVKGLSQDEAEKLITYTEIIRFLNVMNDQAYIMANLRTSLTLATTKTQKDQVAQSAKTINIAKANEFSKKFESFNILTLNEKKELMNTASSVNGIKIALENGSGDTVNSELLKFKNNVTVLTKKYDALLQQSEIALANKY